MVGNFDNVDIGYFGLVVIVLLFDGENMVWFDLFEVVKLVFVVGVCIIIIGIGSFDGIVVKIGGFSVVIKFDVDLLG